VEGQKDRHSPDASSDVAMPHNSRIAPGSTLEAFQRLLEEFADALSMKKKSEHSMVHTGVQVGGARSRYLEERKGSGSGVSISKLDLLVKNSRAVEWIPGAAVPGFQYPLQQCWQCILMKG
jgi:hypothetical protein